MGELAGESTRRYTYSALYWHFGRYGPQDVHVHSCFDHETCNHALIGAGRECDRKAASHREEVLRAR